MGLALGLRKLSPKTTAVAVLKHWPNLSAAAYELGVSAACLHQHKAHSPWFQKIVAEADAKGCDALEQVLYTRGVSGDEYTFNDRIAYLRAHRPELYNPAKVIRVEGVRMERAEAQKRDAVLTNVIDAEIVEGYKKRRGGKALPAGGSGGGVGPK